MSSTELLTRSEGNKLLQLPALGAIDEPGDHDVLEAGAEEGGAVPVHGHGALGVGPLALLDDAAPR